MSFGWLGTFRTGQWLSFRRFILNERKSVDSVINAINAELAKIGTIRVTYATVDEEVTDPLTGATQTISKVSELREAISVSRGSSLAKLMQSYVAHGGNPLDISMFMSPDSMIFKDGLDPEGNPDDDPDEDAETVSFEESPYPYDGVVYPQSHTYSIGGVDKGGFAELKKYPPNRLGGRKNEGDLNSSIASQIRYARRWCAQSLNEKRNMIEARIIKLMDTREQLLRERDEVLVQAVAGTTESIPEYFDVDLFHRFLHVANIISSFDEQQFDIDEDGFADLGTINLEKMAPRDTIFPDDPEDSNTAL